MPRPQRTGAAQDRCPLWLREYVARVLECWHIAGSWVGCADGTRRLRFVVMPGGQTVFLRTGPRCLSLRYQTLRCWTAVVRCTETGAWEYSWCRSVCLDGNRPFAVCLYRRERARVRARGACRFTGASQRLQLTPTLATCQRSCQTSRVKTHARRAAHDRMCARTAARRERIGAKVHKLGGGRFLHFARERADSQARGLPVDVLAYQAPRVSCHRRCREQLAHRAVLRAHEAHWHLAIRSL